MLDFDTCAMRVGGGFVGDVQVKVDGEVVHYQFVNKPFPTAGQAIAHANRKAGQVLADLTKQR